MADIEQNNDAWLKNPNPASYRKDPPPTTDDLRDALANAPEAPRKDQDDGRHPKTDDAGNAGRPGADERRDAKPSDASSSGAGGQGSGRAGDRARGEIFDDCPVTPLGVRGKYAYYLDVLGQLRAIDNHNAQNIQGLFGHQIPRLCYNFPQWKKGEDGTFERVKNRFDQTTASMSMHAAASECGVFNPDNAVRGVGAWTDEDGQLVYHMGDQVLFDGKVHKPGRLGRHIYPAQPTIPHPNTSDTAPDPTPEILRTLETWNWTNKDVHPFIALGMIATQMLCGALDWRPVFWLLAPAGAGKSELQRLVKMLHGDDGLVQTTDATKSGITSKLGQSSLPVAVDELEPGDERSTKERDIIALARVAASGGEWFRGSADQTGVGGKVYSAFLFSSILIPGVMKTQDVQRLIRLELKPLEKGSAKLSLQPRTWRARGARLKQLLIARWDTWPERLEAWRHALEIAGVTGRDADNWGTVLAMADMACNEDLPDEEITQSWAKKIAYVAEADRDDVMNDAEAMLVHLLGQPFDIYRRGELHTVAQWIMSAAQLPGGPISLAGDGSDAIDALDRAKIANEKLAKAGMRVTGKMQDATLFIANKQIPGLLDLFKGTQWAGGVWAQSVKRVPGAETAGVKRLAGIASRGVVIPLTAVPGLFAFPADRISNADQPGAPKTTKDIDDFG